MYQYHSPYPALTDLERMMCESPVGDKAFVSVVVPAYNEASIVKKNLTQLVEYMESLDGDYCWEIVVVNDGSTHETGQLAENFAREGGLFQFYTTLKIISSVRPSEPAFPIAGEIIL